MLKRSERLSLSGSEGRVSSVSRAKKVEILGASASGWVRILTKPRSNIISSNPGLSLSIKPLMEKSI